MLMWFEGGGGYLPIACKEVYMWEKGEGSVTKIESVGDRDRLGMCECLIDSTIDLRCLCECLGGWETERKR